MLENFAAVDTIIKDSVYVKVKKNPTELDRLKAKNAMLSLIEDPLLYVIDTIGFAEDLKSNMKIVDFFSICTSSICFILGAF